MFGVLSSLTPVHLRVESESESESEDEHVSEIIVLDLLVSNHRDSIEPPVYLLPMIILACNYPSLIGGVRFDKTRHASVACRQEEERLQSPVGSSSFPSRPTRGLRGSWPVEDTSDRVDFFPVSAITISMYETPRVISPIVSLTDPAYLERLPSRTPQAS